MRIERSAVLLTFAGALVFGAGASVWQKDFKNWTEKDAQTIMTDSPWAKQMPMPAYGRPGVVVVEPGQNGAPPPTATMGNPSNTTAGTNMSVAGNPGSAGPANPDGVHNLPNSQTPSGVGEAAPAPVSQPPLTIVWASATPVRLAVLKLRREPNAPTDTEIENAMKERPNYVIAVMGLPAPEGGSDPKALAASAFLSVKGKPPAVAIDSSYRKIGNSDVYFFRFVRTSLPIAESDQQLEFRMTFGKMEIKRRFDLKEMRYQGQLTL
jgi:hypothetical protein